MRRFIMLVLADLLLAAGCRLAASPATAPTATWAVAPAPTPIVYPSATAGVSARPSQAPGDDGGWELLRPGLERRHLSVQAAEGTVMESVYVLRIDPVAFRFDVAYRLGAPQTLAEWQAQTGALVVVNGGYFTAEWIATGLIVSAGQASGRSYQGFGGMFAIGPAGPEVRWLAERPHDPAEPLQAAVQAFPMLVVAAAPTSIEEDFQQARRTVVGQDAQGHILILVAGSGTFTLARLSQFLAASDLGLTAALNLDGGPSSGILLAEPAEGVPAFSPLPAVITVFPK
ncbi:MAG: phosphodiester glycosidase family protein [Candidatus Promineifilaceae bacterium]